ncbi:MAG: glycosyltransferase family 2 protein [Anaerolineaceae bacterium]|nr:glycosyltransferase family 2 protein [Anaerolineaceae bacterium]
MKLSVVIPVFNEAESIHLLHQTIHKALKAVKYSWEMILIDDGSQDESPQVLEDLALKDPKFVKVILLRRNFGQTTALAAGIDHASGDIIVLIDADLQNDPEDIPAMVTKIDEGYDVVSGWRFDRKDTFLFRILPSRIANGLISWVTGVHLHDYGCTLKAYRRDILSGFRLYGEMHRFIPAYAGSVGAKIIEVQVNHHPRKYGKAKYGLERITKVILDLMTVKFLSSYASKPNYLFGGIGLVLMAISAIIVLFLVINRLIAGEHIVRSPLLQMSVMLFILGGQSILLGLIAELLVRTYHESQKKATYTIRKVINLKELANDSQVSTK